MTIKIGDKFTSARGHSAIVVEYVNNKNITVEFPSGHREVHQGGNLTRGRIKDKGLPTTHGVGVLGYEPVNVKEQSYVTWSNMLRRVHFPKEGAESHAYGDCNVTPEWLYFLNFKDWFNNQVFEKGYHLDKDLLIKGNTIYCPERCVFLPQEINKFLGNRARDRGEWPLGVSYKTANCKWDAKLSIDGKSVYLGLFTSPEDAFTCYKIAKEADAKRLAKFWKDKIDPRAFEALMRFEVSIDD